MNLSEEKLASLEQKYHKLEEDLNTANDTIDEIKYFLVKMAKNQEILATSFAQWPFIAVPNKDSVAKKTSATETKKQRGSKG
jgi:hypothetical protein